MNDECVGCARLRQELDQARQQITLLRQTLAIVEREKADICARKRKREPVEGEWGAENVVLDLARRKTMNLNTPATDSKTRTKSTATSTGKSKLTEEAKLKSKAAKQAASKTHLAVMVMDVGPNKLYCLCMGCFKNGEAPLLCIFDHAGAVFKHRGRADCSNRVTRELSNKSPKVNYATNHVQGRDWAYINIPGYTGKLLFHKSAEGKWSVDETQQLHRLIKDKKMDIRRAILDQLDSYPSLEGFDTTKTNYLDRCKKEVGNKIGKKVGVSLVYRLSSILIGFPLPH
jgi:hypothetical protein